MRPHMLLPNTQKVLYRVKRCAFRTNTLPALAKYRMICAILYKYTM
jgi:hypothetical protein